MFTPSDLTSRILIAWIPAYLVLMIHGALTEPLMGFLEIFVIYPVLCGLALAIFNFKYRDENEDFLERIGFPYTKVLALTVVTLIVFPLAGVLYAMIDAHLRGSYEEVSWVVIVFGMLIGGQLGQKLKLLSN